MAFYVGQKVALARKPNRVMATFGEAIPVFGPVYTIRDIFVCAGQELLRFVEIVNEPRVYLEGYQECGFNAKYFRPITERKTSIEIFKAMLNPSKTEVEA